MCQIPEMQDSIVWLHMYLSGSGLARRMQKGVLGLARQMQAKSAFPASMDASECS
jgi:hypothetical protein